MHTRVPETQVQTPETQTSQTQVQVQDRILYKDERRELTLIDDENVVMLRLRVRPIRDIANSVHRVIKLYKRERYLEIYIIRDGWYGTGRNHAVEGKVRGVKKLYKMITSVKSIEEFEKLYDELSKRLSR